MGSIPRDRCRFRRLAALLLPTSLMLGCIDATPTAASLYPSPIIVPDAATVHVGDVQVFNVQHATVERFDLSADGPRWSYCVSVDETFDQSNSIRLVALNRCPELVHITAMIGTNRSPVVAVIQVQ
jgi:hypothetical protein